MSRVDAPQALPGPGGARPVAWRTSRRSVLRITPVFALGVFLAVVAVVHWDGTRDSAQALGIGSVLVALGLLVYGVALTRGGHEPQWRADERGIALRHGAAHAEVPWTDVREVVAVEDRRTTTVVVVTQQPHQVPVDYPGSFGLWVEEPATELTLVVHMVPGTRDRLRDAVLRHCPEAWRD